MILFLFYVGKGRGCRVMDIIIKFSFLFILMGSHYDPSKSQQTKT